jgi:hypothetical protein
MKKIILATIALYCFGLSITATSQNNTNCYKPKILQCISTHMNCLVDCTIHSEDALNELSCYLDCIKQEQICLLNTINSCESK